MDMDFLLSRELRDEILRALEAIHRQVGSLQQAASHGSFDTHGAVIGTNVTIIRSCLTNLPWIATSDSGRESA